jgi:predicted amidohydrolase
VDKAEGLVRMAHARGAHVVLLQELFETPYFPQQQDAIWLELAQEYSQHPTLKRMAQLARELHVVLPVSFFERCGQVTLIELQRQQGRARWLEPTLTPALSSARAQP